jgi:hypothetical protein
VERENRYLVVKRSDMELYLTPQEISTIKYLAAECTRRRTSITGRHPRESLVIESDWPEYEPFWKILGIRVDSEESK